MLATTSVFNFWLYELCDVYIVRLPLTSPLVASSETPVQEATKPMTDPSAPAEVRRSAQDTLYTCLDLGLRLLHPFMPFVTEELWQRLPRRPSDPTRSIMLAAFPVSVSHDRSSVVGPTCSFSSRIQRLRTSKLTSNLKQSSHLSKPFVHSVLNITSKAIFKVTHFCLLVTRVEAVPSHIRSLSATLVSTVPSESAMLATQASTIVALTKGCHSAQVLSEQSKVPEGCGSVVISPTLTVFLLVKVSLVFKVSLDNNQL